MANAAGRPIRQDGLTQMFLCTESRKLHRPQTRRPFLSLHRPMQCRLTFSFPCKIDDSSEPFVITISIFGRYRSSCELLRIILSPCAGDPKLDTKRLAHRSSPVFLALTAHPSHHLMSHDHSHNPRSTNLKPSPPQRTGGHHLASTPAVVIARRFASVSSLNKLKVSRVKSCT